MTARVVQRALIRIGFVRTIEISTITQQLERWDKQYGLRPKMIQN